MWICTCPSGRPKSSLALKLMIYLVQASCHYMYVYGMMSIILRQHVLIILDIMLY